MNRPLSGDNTEEYQLRVYVTDRGTPGLTNTTLVRIRVNRNVCQPRFNFNSRTYTIPETQSLGMAIDIININKAMGKANKNKCIHTQGMKYIDWGLCGCLFTCIMLIFLYKNDNTLDRE